MTIEEIKKKKQESGYSVEQLSKLSGVPVGTLQKILSGETKCPRYSTLQALEKVLVPTKHADSSGSKPNPQGESRPYLTDQRQQTEACVSESVTVWGKGAKKQGEYTVSDYNALPNEKRVELIDGVFWEMNSPSMVHQEIIQAIWFKIVLFIQAHNGTCKVLQSPIDVRLDMDDRTIVQPDLLIVCDPSKIRRWGVWGAPDFVLEVISQSTAGKDYKVKAAKYMRAGVRELWLLDPIKMRLLIYMQEDDFPYIGPLEGKRRIGIYQGALEIDLDKIREMIVEYPE